MRTLQYHIDMRMISDFKIQFIIVSWNKYVKEPQRTYISKIYTNLLRSSVILNYHNVFKIYVAKI